MTYNVYVDGSWKPSAPMISGWGFAILNSKDEMITSQSGIVFSESRQIDGELEATIMALTMIDQIKKPIVKINIHYDYAGIGNWAQGLWKGKSTAAQSYIARIHIFEKLIDKVNFIKIESHSGNKWNDFVDSLAKKQIDDYVKNFRLLNNE